MAFCLSNSDQPVFWLYYLCVAGLSGPEPAKLENKLAYGSCMCCVIRRDDLE